jgi:hypothetical protein
LQYSGTELSATNKTRTVLGKMRHMGSLLKDHQLFFMVFYSPKQNKCHQQRPKADVPHTISVIPD